MKTALSIILIVSLGIGIVYNVYKITKTLIERKKQKDELKNNIDTDISNQTDGVNNNNMEE